MNPSSYNPESFPIKQLVPVVPVTGNDPRVSLRGGKKVIATTKIPENQIV